MVKSSAFTFKKTAGVLTLAFFYWCLSSVAVAQSQPESAGQSEPESFVEVYLSLGDKHGFPLPDAQETFDCTDQIFSVVKVHYYEEGKYNLEVEWLDPNQRQRERTEYPFTVPDPSIQPTTRLWSWLRLKRGAGAGLFQWINPSAGLEDLIGIWQLKVSINGKEVAKSDFEVSC